MASWLRVTRGLGGALALTCSVYAPLPLGVRVLAFGTMGAYLLWTALVGSCFASRLLARLGQRGETRR